MSRRKDRPTPDLPLFDFPLDGSEDDPAPPRSPVEMPEGATEALTSNPTTRPRDEGRASAPNRADVMKPLTPLPVPKPAPAKGAEADLLTPLGTQPSLFDPIPESTPPPAAEGAAATPSAAPSPQSIDRHDETPPAPFRARVLAGLADFALHLGMVGAMVGGATVLGVQVGWDDWPALGLLVIAFSFLYWVVPLAFWGQTPGMAWIGIGSRALDDEPLSFSQTALRWLGALLTVLLAGIPLALATTGSSLSDRLSQSKTHQL